MQLLWVLMAVLQTSPPRSTNSLCHGGFQPASKVLYLLVHPGISELYQVHRSYHQFEYNGLFLMVFYMNKAGRGSRKLSSESDSCKLLHRLSLLTLQDQHGTIKTTERATARVLLLAKMKIPSFMSMRYHRMPTKWQIPLHIRIYMLQVLFRFTPVILETLHELRLGNGYDRPQFRCRVSSGEWICTKVAGWDGVPGPGAES